MSIVGDRELAQRAQAGDISAFGELVRRHQTAVFNVGYRMFGNRQDAEDATQEAFLRAFRAFNSFDSRRPLAPWLKRIATNLCLNWLESERIRPAVSAVDLARPGQREQTPDYWPGNRPLPEQQLLQAEQAERVRQAILRLPPHYRAVVELRHFQELAYNEIAETLGRSLSNVKSDLFRARQQLAQNLAEEK